MKYFYLFLLNFFITLTIHSQNVVQLANASFEDTPRHSKPPRAWIDCGFKGESPVDVHPAKTFHVTMSPYDGDTYVGMVARDNETWESMSQKLEQPLLAGKIYQFSIYLTHSETYVSISRVTNRTANYNQPIKLRIWGGDNYCDKKQLLAETPLIKNNEWREYYFEFYPDIDIEFIILEAFYEESDSLPYNGNLLLDNASPIKMLTDEQSLIKGYKPSITVILNKLQYCNLEDKLQIPHIGVLKNVIHFEKTARSMGIRQYIQSTTREQLLINVKALEAVNLLNTSELIKELIQIYDDNKAGKEVTPTDLEYFEDAEGLFLEVLAEDQLFDKIQNYFALHRDEILDEMDYCN